MYAMFHCSSTDCKTVEASCARLNLVRLYKIFEASEGCMPDSAFAFTETCQASPRAPVAPSCTVHTTPIALPF
jgi:hypothetical protein